MVATLEEHKDHKTLLEAWKIVEENNLDLELNIAGDGSLKDELQNLKISLNLKNVNFLGTVNDIPSLLWQSDVFVFSTTFQEGFGTVLIEALAAGCAIIASDVPACREVLKGGEYGKLVPMNDPISLSKAIILNLTEEPTSIQLEQQMKYAAKFSPQNMIIQYLDLVKLKNNLNR
jgi:glycosyltransferase involved in cell wall biosynthesis